MKSHKVLGLLVVFLATATLLSAQATPDVEQGMKPYGSYHGGAIDQVNLSNRNLILQAGLFDYSQRGGDLAYPIVLRYNNKNYSLYQQPCPAGTKLGTTQCPLRMFVIFGPNPFHTVNKSFGASVTLGFEGLPEEPVVRTDTGLNNNGQEQFVNAASVGMPDGSVHALATTNSGSVTLDGSGFAFPNNGNLTGRSGTQYSIVGNLAQDRNGNQIAINSSGNWVDTLGRQIPGAPGPGPSAPASAVPASTANLSSCPALSYSFQPATYAYTWNLPTVSGGTLALILCYTPVLVRTGVPQTPPTFAVNQAFNMLQSVVFPDNTYWAFEYDAADPNNTSSYAFGDLLKVTFPTGGSITYTWGLPDQSCSGCVERALQTRTVDANDGNGPHQWSYATGPGTTSTISTVVTDPLKNDTVHTFTALGQDTLGIVSSSNYETLAQYYQGSYTSGTLFKTVKTDYQYTANPWDPAVIASGGVPSQASTVTNVFPIRVTTTLPNGLVSKVETDYDNALAYHGALDGITYTTPCSNPDPANCGAGSATMPVTNYTGSYGKAIETREYDWGNNAPGPLLRRTTTSYRWQSNSAYLSNNFLDLISSVSTYDGVGNLLAQTNYGYDEYALNSSNISTGHNSSPINGTTRGNRTSMHSLLNGSAASTANCPVAISNGYAVTYTQYNDTGTLYQATDACGTSAGDKNHTTTHTYDPAYQGAYPTQSCNALGQCVSATYDLDTGLTTSFTDANKQTSNFSYDPRWRVTQALGPKDPVSGLRPETDFDYSVVNQVKRSKRQTSGAWITDYAYFDGVGRTKQTQLVDPEGDDFVDTTYDLLGRVSTVSNPHRSTSSPTDGITTTTYDALGRVTQVTAQDSSISTTDYSNLPTITTTDPAGNLRRSRSDALGRVVEVDESEPGPSSPGSPGQGGITVSGSLRSSTTSTQATGSVTVSGKVQQSCSYVTVCNCLCVRERQCTVDPGGTVQITVNGYPDSYTYTTSDTANSVASGLVAAINKDGNAFAWASGPTSADATDCTISLQARTPGPNYSLSTQGTSNDTADGFSSFDATSASGPALAGGQYPTTTYDSGTVTVTVSGTGINTFSASASYNQNLNSTPQLMAQALASALSASGSPVTATVASNGTTINITAQGLGAGTDLTVTGGTSTSFTASSTTLSGGANPGGLYAPYVTTYQYNARGDLLCVHQKATDTSPDIACTGTTAPTVPAAWRQRFFTYDSLSRLLTAINPESGTITYSYDANGNVLSKTDARGVGTSYSYDVLNRLTQKTYSDDTPAVTYGYDVGCCGVNPQNGVGRLTDTHSPNTELVYVYDALGRITQQADCPPSGIARNACYWLSATYDLASDVTSLSYPDGQTTITFSTNSAGRTLSAVDAASVINYATSATHSPDGSLTSFISGNNASFAGITNTFSYNNRLQPIFMSAAAASPSQTVFSIGYDFHFGNGDNGNVFRLINNKDNTRTQTFTYDQLNRLISAQNAGTDCTQTVLGGNLKYWGNTYTYDAWGNLTNNAKIPTACAGENLNAPALANNQLSGYGYDAAGNMTQDLTFGHNYAFDGESRVKSVDTTAATYTYNSLSNRVRKDLGSGPSTEYFFFGGQIVAELNPATGAFTNYVYFAGDRVARRAGTTGPVSYYFSDFLKTTDIVTDANGKILNESDYDPWGGELQILGNDSNNHYRFTGKERDNETQLDYFGARYYSNGLGRFITPDWNATPVPVPYADLTDPQTLNQYSYVRNIPTARVDADGHDGGVLALAAAACAAVEPCGAVVGTAFAVGAFVAAPVVGMTVAIAAPPMQNTPDGSPNLVWMPSSRHTFQRRLVRPCQRPACRRRLSARVMRDQERWGSRIIKQR